MWLVPAALPSGIQHSIILGSRIGFRPDSKEVRVVVQELRWRTSDGLGMRAQAWRPEGRQSRALVYIVHGLGEHSGRWEHVASALAAAGYAVLVSDLRGHGLSEGPRGHAPSLDALMDDITIGLRHGRALTDGPVYLGGHSLGGSLALNYALRQPEGLAGLVVSGPWLELSMRVPSWKTSLGRVLTRVAPTFAMPNGLDLGSLSHDEKVVAAYKADPLVHDRISVAMGIMLLDAGRWALAHAAELRVPLLLMHGLDDRITSAAASQRFAEQVPGHCTFRGWEGLYHEIHNEPQGEPVLRTVLAWLDTHTTH